MFVPPRTPIHALGQSVNGPERDMGGADVSNSRNYPPATRHKGRELPIANVPRGYGSDLSPHLNFLSRTLIGYLSAKKKLWVRIPRWPKLAKASPDRHNMLRLLFRKVARRGILVGTTLMLGVVQHNHPAKSQRGYGPAEYKNRTGTRDHGD